MQILYLRFLGSLDVLVFMVSIVIMTLTLMGRSNFNITFQNNNTIGDIFVGTNGYTINNLVNGENYDFKIAFENGLGLDEHTA